MKVSELEGQALDNWVARALGWIDKGNDWWGTETPGTTAHRGTWHPSTDWSQGGPIIELMEIGIRKGYEDPDDPDDYIAVWLASILLPDLSYGPEFAAAAPLTAAMRAFVASKFGKEVPSEPPEKP